jgi:hypothetical protein
MRTGIHYEANHAQFPRKYFEIEADIDVCVCVCLSLSLCV